MQGEDGAAAIIFSWLTHLLGSRAGKDGDGFFLVATRRRSTDGRFLQNKAKKKNKDALAQPIDFQPVFCVNEVMA